MATRQLAETLRDDVAAIRRFNRFYTRQAGLLEPKHLHTDVSLPEARILYELAQADRLSATDLVRALGIDAGQLSRTLQVLKRRQLVSRKSSARDKRQAEIALTPKGRAAFGDLNKRTEDFFTGLLRKVPPRYRAEVVDAMQTIERTLGPDGAARPEVKLRTHREGDIGWIVSRNGALYAQEYGWTIAYEALAAEIAGAFIRNFDSRRERCWIAEVDGRPVGSVMLVNAGNDVGKLRLLLVESDARGLGVGKLLVHECIRTARAFGYSSMTLWTQSILIAARGIYRSAGFRMVEEKPHHSFGHDLVGETWEMEL